MSPWTLALVLIKLEVLVQELAAASQVFEVDDARLILGAAAGWEET